MPELVVRAADVVGHVVPGLDRLVGPGDVVVDVLEVDPDQVGAPLRHRPRLEVAEGLEAQLRHPLRLALDAADLRHDLGVDALRERSCGAARRRASRTCSRRGSGSGRDSEGPCAPRGSAGIACSGIPTEMVGVRAHCPPRGSEGQPTRSRPTKPGPMSECKRDHCVTSPAVSLPAAPPPPTGRRRRQVAGRSRPRGRCRCSPTRPAAPSPGTRSGGPV